jgi:hypothetical protein
MESKTRARQVQGRKAETLKAMICRNLSVPVPPGD